MTRDASRRDASRRDASRRDASRSDATGGAARRRGAARRIADGGYSPYRTDDRLTGSFERLDLELAHPFGIARGTVSTYENVVVRLEYAGETGIGGAGPSPHYGETATTVERTLPSLLEAIEGCDPLNAQAIDAALADAVDDNPAAKASVSTAAYDLAAKLLDVPLYGLLGLDPARSITSSFTIGIDETDTMREKTREAVDAGYTVLKTKVGTDRDREIIDAVREAAPDATIRVDANEAWTPEQAVENSEWLAAAGVEFVEQPVPADDPDGMRHVRTHGALPVAADESCITLEDVPAVADACDIVNIKLMKCGGILEAVRMAHTARAHDLEVMLGCMIETNASIAAACHLTPLLDYADLDGSLLLADDPYDGVPLPNGDVDLSGVERGTGARPT